MSQPGCKGSLELILTIFPKRRLDSCFHFQAQKSKFHLWVLQITKLLYVKLCIGSSLQTGTNLGNRAVPVYKSLHVCRRAIIMTGLWQLKWQYVSSKAYYGYIICHLHMWYICIQTEIHIYMHFFPSHRYTVTNHLNLKISLCMLIMEDRNFSGTARQIDHLHILQHFLSTQRWKL